jgi:CDP-diacylglycerol--serine O-phosphatidyltransferase
MRIRNNIPNGITACNLLAGCIGIVLMQEGALLYASIAILAAGLFDLLDGLVARAIGAASSIGGELDSLADLVSFGVLPSLIAFRYLAASSWGETFPLLPYATFLIAIFAAVRLAIFNLDSEQSEAFKGVPVPANALFWCGIPLAGAQIDGFGTPSVGKEVFEASIFAFLVHPAFVLSMTLLFSALMVAPLRATSFKFKHFAWKGNESRYILILAVLILFPLFRFKALPFLVLLYPILSSLEPRQASP